MDELTLDGENGRLLRLSNPTDPDAEGMWSFVAELSVPEGTARTTVLDLGDGLAKFLRQLADDWAGFEGVREFSSIEGQLDFTCRHNGRGTVECKVSLGQPWPPFWELRAEMEFGAGAHLERLAGEAEAFARRL